MPTEVQLFFGNQRASHALLPVTRQCCKCQLKCQRKAGPLFISFLWRASLWGSRHEYCLEIECMLTYLFRFSLSFLGLWEKTHATAEGASHGTAPLSWVRDEVISLKGRFVTPTVLCRKPPLLRFNLHLTGNSGDPQRLWCVCVCVCVCVCLVAQSCPTLCDPMDCSLPDSSAHGCPRQEYWSGIFLTQGWSQHLLCLLHSRWILYCWATGKPLHLSLKSMNFLMWNLWILIRFVTSDFCVLNVLSWSAVKRSE